MATWSRNGAMTTEPIAALLSDEPQPPPRADDAEDQLSPLDAPASGPGFLKLKNRWTNMGASAKFHAIERQLSEVEVDAPQGGGRRARSPEQRAAGRLKLHEKLQKEHAEHLARYGRDERPGAPVQSVPSQVAARRPAHACALTLPRARGWGHESRGFHFGSKGHHTAPLMPAQTFRNHSTLHDIDAWLGVEDFDEQMEKGTMYDAVGLLMKPLWSILDAAADLGPRSADVSTSRGRIQWARCPVTN